MTWLVGTEYHVLKQFVRAKIASAAILPVNQRQSAGTKPSYPLVCCLGKDLALPRKDIQLQSAANSHLRVVDRTNQLQCISSRTEICRKLFFAVYLR